MSRLGTRPPLETVVRAVLLVIALAPACFLGAQDGEGAPSPDGAATPASPQAAPPVDFRGKVTLAYGLVVGTLVVYVLISARRNARVAEEIAFLEQRVAELERRG